MIYHTQRAERFPIFAPDETQRVSVMRQPPIDRLRSIESGNCRRNRSGERIKATEGRENETGREGTRKFTGTRRNLQGIVVVVSCASRRELGAEETETRPVMNPLTQAELP